MGTLSLDDLLAPLSSDEPHGSDCGYTFSYQKMSAMADYLNARAEARQAGPHVACRLRRRERRIGPPQRRKLRGRRATSPGSFGSRPVRSCRDARPDRECARRILQIGRELLTDRQDWRVARG